MAESPWDVLGVPAGSDLPTTKKAWRTLAHLYHPDHHHGASDAVRREAARRLDAVNSAFRAIQASVDGVASAATPTAPPPPRPRSSEPPPSAPRRPAEPSPARDASGGTPRQAAAPVWVDGPPGTATGAAAHQRLSGIPSVWLPPEASVPRTRTSPARYLEPVSGDPNTVWIESDLRPAQDFVFAALRAAKCTFRVDVVPQTFGVRLTRTGLAEVTMQFRKETDTVTRCQFFGDSPAATSTALAAVRAHVGKPSVRRSKA